MKKWILLILTFILTACSSNASGIENDLYRDGKSIANIFYKQVENSSTVEMNDDLDTQISKFEAKYDVNDEKWSTEESTFIFDISKVYLSYIEYCLEKEDSYMDEFYDNVENLKTKYNIKL